MSLAIFISAAREHLERARGEDEIVVRRERGELVRMRAERQAGEFGDLLGRALGELGMRVEAGADGRAADREVVDLIERFLARDHRAIELR